MLDQGKTKAQLIAELKIARLRVAELEERIAKSPAATEDDVQVPIDEQKPRLSSVQLPPTQLNGVASSYPKALTAISDATLAIVAETGNPCALDVVIKQAVESMDASLGEIFLLKSDPETMELAAKFNPDNLSTPLPHLRRTLAREAIKCGAPLVVSKEAQSEHISHHKLQGIGQAVALPLKRGSRVIGALSVFSTQDAAGLYLDDDIPLLNLFAALGTVAIENLQLHKKMQYCLKELDTINAVSRAVTSTLNLQEILTIITDDVTQQLSAAAASIALYTPDHNELRFAAASGEGAAFMIGKRIRMGQGIMGWVVEHGEPQLVSDVSKDDRFYREFDEQQIAFKTRSILCVPLEARGQTIGVMGVFNKKKGAFGEEDLQLLMLLTAPAATAIENAQLYEQSQQKISELQQAELELQQRATQLILINDIGRQIAAELELDSVLSQATTLIQTSFDYHHVALFLIEEAMLILKAVAGSYQPYLPLGQEQKLSDGINGWVATHGQKIVANDVRLEPRYEPLISDRSVTQSELCLPIKVAGYVVGCMDIHSSHLGAFTENNVVALEALANQIAAAIKNAKLYEEIQQELLDRKKTEVELRKSEERFRQVITSISDHIYVSELTVSGNRQNFYHSPNIEILTGYPRERFASDWQFWSLHLIHPDDRQKAIAQSHKLDRGHSSEVEYRLIRADGEVIWVRDSARVEIRHGLKIIYGVVANITERKRRERELEIIAALADTLRIVPTRDDIVPIILDRILDLLQMDGAALGIHDTDTNELIIEQARGEWVQATGKRLPPSAKNQQYLFLDKQLYVNNDIQDNRLEAWPEPFRKLNAIACVSLSAQTEYVGTLVVGHRNQITADVVPLLTTLGNIAANALYRAKLFEALQAFNKALADERALLAQRIEERTAELRSANAELARAARLKDEFLANMSHELRTPLNAVLGMSEILRSNVYGSLNEEQLNAVRHIEEGGSHLLSLINDILDLSKIEAGKLDLIIGPVSIPNLCQACVQFVMQVIQKKRIKIFQSIDDNLETIQADERRLKQILVNLLSNAVKFTPEGGQIGLEVESEPAQGTVHFTVWDNGIGISADDMKRLFKPFVQIDSGLTRKQEGTGLGLSLVYRLTEMHGGSVSLESEVGKGSRFTISMPLVTSNGETADANLSSVTPAEKVKVNRENFRGVILLAEDNEANIVTIHDYLQVKGYKIVIARDGSEAVNLAVDIHPDLILMDIQMPIIDGLEAIRQIRSMEGELANRPIIALTALAMSYDKQRCLDAGANEYLRKPVSLARLSDVIEMYLA